MSSCATLCGWLSAALHSAWLGERRGEGTADKGSRFEGLCQGTLAGVTAHLWPCDLSCPLEAGDPTALGMCRGSSITLGFGKR